MVAKQEYVLRTLMLDPGGLQKAAFSSHIRYQSWSLGDIVQI